MLLSIRCRGFFTLWTSRTTPPEFLLAFTSQVLPFVRIGEHHFGSLFPPCLLEWLFTLPPHSQSVTVCMITAGEEQIKTPQYLLYQSGTLV